MLLGHDDPVPAPAPRHLRHRLQPRVVTVQIASVRVHGVDTSTQSQNDLFGEGDDKNGKKKEEQSFEEIQKIFPDAQAMLLS